jgi:hypothetical protein
VPGVLHAQCELLGASRAASRGSISPGIHRLDEGAAHLRDDVQAAGLESLRQMVMAGIGIACRFRRAATGMAGYWRERAAQRAGGGRDRDAGHDVDAREFAGRAGDDRRRPAIERSRRFLEFFAASIENDNTRMAYYRAVCSFFAWLEQPSGLFLGEDRRLAALDHVLRPAHSMRRVDREDLADDQPIEQHPDRGQVLLNCRPGRDALFHNRTAGGRDLERFDIRRDMEGLERKRGILS